MPHVQIAPCCFRAFSDRFFVRADVRKLNFDTEVTVETLGDVRTAEVDPLVYGLSFGVSL